MDDRQRFALMVQTLDELNAEELKAVVRSGSDRVTVLTVREAGLLDDAADGIVRERREVET